MTPPNVTVANVVPGLGGSTLLKADVRLELAPNLRLVIRDVRLIETRHGGRFVALPNRILDGFTFDLVGFEGDGAAAIVEAIRQALKRQLATTTDSIAEVADDGRPF